MKRKKMISTAVAGMLVAAQMVMPVVAASDGEVNVDVETITPVIRVEVPTSLTVAVNQFEKGDMGSQIYSTAFGIKNKSEVPVKMTVTSTATLANSGVTLVAKKETAEAEATDKKAWLAVAAQVVDGKYIADTTKNIKDLTEANKNVTTFDATDKKAVQTFYLATATSPVSVTYKAIKKATAADAKAAAKAVTYTKFYKVEEYQDSSSNKITTVALLTTALESSDIYEIKDDGSAVKFFAKGTTTNLAVSTTGVKYYKLAASAETAIDDMQQDVMYVYGEGADGAKTGFRYIGKLSQKDGWSKDDIKKITIAYDIDAISQDSYNGIKAACTYSLYNNLVGDTVNGVSVMNDAATPVAVATKNNIASRLKNENNSKVQFVLTPAQLAVVKVEKLAVTAVKIQPTKAAGANETPAAIDINTGITSVTNPSPVANSDGKLYTIPKDSLSSSSVTSIDYIEVTYKADGATDGMTVKYTFAAQ